MPPIPLLREIDTEEQWLDMLSTEVWRKKHIWILVLPKLLNTYFNSSFVTRHFELEMLQRLQLDTYCMYVTTSALVLLRLGFQEKCNFEISS